MSKEHVRTLIASLERRIERGGAGVTVLRARLRQARHQLLAMELADG